MPHRFRALILLPLILITLAWPGQKQQPQAAAPAPPEKISRFGQYSGYSPVLYNSTVRTSVYLTMRDGVKIAIDILRPARDGKAVEEKLPVVWTHNRYRRAFKIKDRLITVADSPDIRNLIMHGYVAASADVRGSGASFGASKGIFTKEETQDAYEITEWLAGQPWSNGNVGMFGGSYLGITQLMAAGAKPPHLKAIFPVVALFDLYEFGTQGGIPKDDFLRSWSDLTVRLDTEQPAAPVDADKDGSLLKRAIEQHRKENRPLISIMPGLNFRDSVDPVSGEAPGLAWHPAARLADINASGVPVYIWGGWFDSFTRHAFLAFRNLTSPRRLVVGAWSHSAKDPEIIQEEYRLLAVEEYRWFDRWLKGIDNGIMGEPPVLYQGMVAPKKNIWKAAASWPPPEAKASSYFLAAGRSLTSASLNDGKLLPEAPKKAGQDVYPVDYSATTGTSTRWDNAVGGGFGYPDLAPNDVKGLTYTTPALKTEVEVTGTPVVHVWLSSTAPDADLFAYLEEVDDKGVSQYVTEGALRASLRAVSEAPYDNLGWPYHRAYAADSAPLKAGEPVELVFALEPTSNVFNAGNRIRLTLTCADKDNAATPKLDPPPTVIVSRGPERMSFVSLPVVPVPAAASAPASFYLYFVLGLVLVLAVAFAFYFRSRVGKKS
jgi:uncharacterized protein